MRLRNATTGQLIAEDIRIATRFLERMIGFLDKKDISNSEGIWFPDCSVIHTIGMSAPIDVVFLDHEDRVVRTVPNVSRNRFGIFCAGARSVVELGCGALEHCDVLHGDRFVLEHP